jgi:spermidine synthase
MKGFRLTLWIMVSLGILAGFLAYERIIYHTDSPYGKVYLVGNYLKRCITHDLNSNTVQSCYSPLSGFIPSTWLIPENDYNASMARGALKYAKTPKRILSIGLGGGSVIGMLQKIYPDATIDAVDINPAMVMIANDYFGVVPNKNLHIHTMDGYDFIRKHPENTYDYVLLDAYQDRSIPDVFVGDDFIRALMRVNRDGAIVAINLYAEARDQGIDQSYSPYFESLDREYIADNTILFLSRRQTNTTPTMSS